MVVIELINKSVYGTIGYIDSLESIDRTEQYILYNLPVLQEYKNVIVATNFNSLEWEEQYNAVWKEYFPECILIASPCRMAHELGPMSFNNLLYGIKYLATSAISAPPYGVLNVTAPSTRSAIALARCSAYTPPRL